MSRAFGLGVFIAVALLILATGIFLIGDKQFLFSSTYPLKAEFPNVAGLSEGAEVRVGGMREGTVKQVELSRPPDRKVTVVMKMDNSTKGIIHKDSVAAIKTEGMLGDKYVEISFGSKEAAAVDNGDVIRAEPTVDMAEVANSVALQAKAGLAAFQEDMQALKQNVLLRGFFNRRGYEDSSELTKHAISRLPGKPRIREFAYDARELFEKPDSAKLKNPKALDEAGKFLEENAFGLAVVGTFGGTVGDTEKERVLTQGQAMVVRDYLVQNFALDDTRIKTMGRGKATNPGDSGKTQIFIYSAPAGQRPTPRGK
jgi:outer membrane protein OmpA-like peptidoglycan-associated protein